ncbi:hypothetical protein SLEP1_g29661 [Rubroshorea leprosula]|uniref:Uncharacterized protein n=1 Tax=Rubroshorea leprosula TaxID=152421 RepID=A0AAV5K7J4_9ROSI|nr:hypothetical protein SLEP1_g29661 [Rubroshorea leprosula]
MGRVTQLFSETLASLRRLWFCYDHAKFSEPRRRRARRRGRGRGDGGGGGDGDGGGDGGGGGGGGGWGSDGGSGGGWIVSEKEDDEANEAVKKRGRGRPPKQLSVEEEEIRHKKNIQRNRDYRENKKGKFNHLQEQQELFIKFCKEKGITEEFKAFCEKRNLGSKVIQTGGLEGVTAANSSSLGAIVAHQGERPATAYTTPSHPPIDGFTAEAHQNYGQSVAALATQGLLSTNKVTQIQMINAELTEKVEISKDALDLQVRNAVTLGWNLLKKQLQSLPPGSEFLDLPLLDPSLQNQFNEDQTLIGQGHPIDDKVAMQSDDPPVVVPRSFFSFYNWLENEVAREPNAFAPLGDAANIAANARANNVEHEDDANYQRMDEATEVDRCVSMWLRDPDGGEDP